MNIEEEEKIRISIVIPVHNRSEYLRETLDSIFAQSFQNFEVICVDDASSDKMIKYILQEYQIKYNYMKVIALDENVGAGEARNIGFSKAKGTYTIFLDADDIFANDFLEKMYERVSREGADVCLCGYQEFFIEDDKKKFGYLFIPNEYNINKNDREDWLLDLPTAAWNKLCKTQFLKENNICFQSLDSCNDVYFSCMVMINATKKCLVNDTPLVFYRTNSESQISNNRSPVDLYKAVERLCHTEKKNCDNGLFLRWIGALLLKNGILEMLRCDNEIYNKTFYSVIKQFFSNYNVDFYHKLLAVCAENVRKLPYESNWISGCRDFLGQLRMTKEKLKEEISDDSLLFLWGLGYRGNKFQQFCREEHIILQGVADIKDRNIGSETEYGNKIVDTEYVLQNGGLIIASNRNIYEYLSGRGLKVLNLDEYCFS